VGVGIMPEIEIGKTVDDFLKKKDRALDSAVKYLKKR
jgi:hypothetical protein